MIGFAATGLTGTLGLSIENKLLSVDRSIMSDQKALSELFSSYKIRNILHLASPTKTFEKGGTNQEYRYGIFETTMNLFDVFVNAGGIKFGYVSSAHVYGEKGGESTLKESDKCKPISDYAKWKLETEVELEARAKRNGIQVLVMRPFSIFGNGMRAHFLAGRLETESKSGRFSPISYALDYRDFSTPREVTTRMIRVMESQSEDIFITLNICSGVAQTVKDKVLSYYSDFPEEKFNLKVSQLPYLVGDPTKLQKFLKDT